MSISNSNSAPGELKRAAAGNVGWQGASYLTGKLLLLISTVVLARLLTPRDFGLVGLALVFITYADVVTDLGVAQALVYLPPDRRSVRAATGISLAVSGSMVVVAFVAAPFAARFFSRPEITPMFRVLSLSLLFGAVGQVPDFLLRRDLRFRRRIVSDLSRSVAAGGVSIGLAVAGAGPWAIIAGYVIGDAVWSAVAWSLVDERPTLDLWRIRWAEVKPLVAYGAPAAMNGLILSLVFDIDYLIVGRVLGPRPLGQYSLAFRVPEMAIINVFFVLSAVAFPMFTRARHDRDRLRRGYLTSVRLQTAFGMAAGVGMAVVAPMLVHVVFGPKWTPAIVPLEALAMYAAFRSLGIGAIDLYKGVGRPALAMWTSVLRLAVLVPALLVAVHFGIVAVAWTQAVVALALAVFMQAVALRMLELPLRRLVLAAAPALALGLGVAAGAGAVRLWLHGPEAVRLVTAMAGGALGGLAALLAVDRSFVGEVTGLLRGRTSRPTVPGPDQPPVPHVEKPVPARTP